MLFCGLSHLHPAVQDMYKPLYVCQLRPMNILGYRPDLFATLYHINTSLLKTLIHPMLILKATSIHQKFAYLGRQ